MTRGLFFSGVLLAVAAAGSASTQSPATMKPIEIRVVVDRANLDARSLVAQAPVYILGVKGTVLASATTDDRGHALLRYTPSEEMPSLLLVEDKNSYISGMRFVRGLSEYYVQVTPWVIR